MHRQWSIGLVFLSLVLCVPSSEAQPVTLTSPARPTTTAITATSTAITTTVAHIPLPPHPIQGKHIVHNVLTTKQLLTSLTTGDTTVGVGGFVCTTTQVVSLHVNANQTLTVNPLKIYVEQGDCLEWQVDDPVHVAIHRINFDYPNKVGGNHTQYTVGFDFCTKEAPTCTLYVALDAAHYGYGVEVRVGNTIIKADPEGDVGCMGCAYLKSW